jgi:hypothetical protein
MPNTQKDTRPRYDLIRLSTSDSRVNLEANVEDVLSFGVDVKSDFALDEAFSYMKVTCELKLLAKIAEGKEFEVGAISIIGEFQLLEFKQFVNGNKIRMPKQFALHILSILISAGRGALLVKLEDTKWKNVFVPLIYPDAIEIPDEISFVPVLG